MNYKRTLCYLAISALATSLHADTANEQELREQLAKKQQELHELTEKIMQQEKFVQECISNVNARINRYLGKNESHDSPKYDKVLGECSDFFDYFWSGREKNILFNEFLKDDSQLTFVKFYYLCLFYEKNLLKRLIEQWEKLAQQVTALLTQTSYRTT